MTNHYPVQPTVQPEKGALTWAPCVSDTFADNSSEVGQSVHGPTDQDLLRLGFATRQVEVLRDYSAEDRQDIYDLFVRMLMEDDPALEDIEDLL